MPSLLVTVGTDGSKDWVKTPDGQRFALGPVSVLTLVTRLIPNTKVARKALDEFLKNGEAMLAVDDSQLWGLLAPRRARWATGPFMASEEGVSNMGGRSIEARELGWGGVSFLDQDFIDSKKAGLTVDTYSSNLKSAQSILTKAKQTVTTISRLSSAGKKFNAARARADVAQVTTRVASICADTELTESWVRDDLVKLAARNDRIHRLFHPVAADKPPKAKFKTGDRVKVMDDGEELYTGKVQQVVEYDSYQETWKYRIEIEGRGKRMTFNEKSLQKR
jgi:hypothetical protein